MEGFGKVLEGLAALGIGETWQRDVFGVVSAVLHLGQALQSCKRVGRTCREGAEGVVLQDEEALRQAARLLGRSVGW